MSTPRLLNMITETRLRATKGNPMAKYTEGTHASGERLFFGATEAFDCVIRRN